MHFDLFTDVIWLVLTSSSLFQIVKTLLLLGFVFLLDCSLCAGGKDKRPKLAAFSLRFEQRSAHFSATSE